MVRMLFIAALLNAITAFGMEPKSGLYVQFEWQHVIYFELANFDISENPDFIAYGCGWDYTFKNRDIINAGIQLHSERVNIFGESTKFSTEDDYEIKSAHLTIPITLDLMLNEGSYGNLFFCLGNKIDFVFNRSYNSIKGTNFFAKDFKMYKDYLIFGFKYKMEFNFLDMSLYANYGTKSFYLIETRFPTPEIQTIETGVVISMSTKRK